MPRNERARAARRRLSSAYRKLQRDYSRAYRLTAAGMIAQARHNAKRRHNRG